jgi:primase-polymerase (primpol)-like protein
MTHTLVYTGPTATDLDHMPAVLKRLPQWVLFQLLEAPNARGELTLKKVPIIARTLQRASSTNTKTWAPYDDCVAALPKALATWAQDSPTAYNGKPATYQGGGLGFVFTAEDPFMPALAKTSFTPVRK